MGGGIKNTTTQMMTFNSALTINSINDLASIVGPQRGYKITVFTAADIQRVKDTLPPRPPTLKGALKIHELVMDGSGKVLAKQITSDAKYFTVELKGGYVVPASASRRLAQPQLTTYSQEVDRVEE